VTFLLRQEGDILAKTRRWHSC